MILIEVNHLYLLLVIICHVQALDYSGSPYEFDSYSWEHCKFEEFVGYAVYGRNELTMPDADIDQCKEECREATDFHCQSFDYNTRTKACFLSSGNRQSPRYGAHANSVHYEKQCATVWGYEYPDDKQETLDFPGKLVYEDGHCYVHFGPIGSSSNVVQSDQVLAFRGNITKVKVIYSTVDYTAINALQLSYGNSSASVPDTLHNIQATEIETRLEAGEYIRAIYGAYRSSFLTMLKLTTNRRVLGPYGDDSNAFWQFTVDSTDKRLAYISYASTNREIALMNFYFYC